MVQAQFTFITNNGSITITRYTGPGGSVVIPSMTNGLPVTSITSRAFQLWPNLTGVVIPDTVTNIESRAFGDFHAPSGAPVQGSLTSLVVGTNNPVYMSENGVLFNKSQTTLIQYPQGKAESYTIPNSVLSIADSAFYYCNNLTNTTIPNNVINIGNGAFASCGNLTNILIGDGVAIVGTNAFFFCTNLRTITVDTNNPVFMSEDGVLFNKSWTRLLVYPQGKAGGYTIPGSVTSVQEDTFYWCSSLTDVTIPVSVTGIGPNAFARCYSLTNVTIPPSVTSIGDSAFAYSGLTSLTVPGSITNMGPAAFSDCNYLTCVLIGTGVAGIGNAAFQGCNSLTNVSIPNSVTSIGGGAFREDTSLTSVTIPAGVTTIGSQAFINCYHLSQVYFLGNAPIPSDDASVFSSDLKATVYYLPGAAGWASTFGGRPTAVWTPQVQTSDGSFGVRTNQFGFNITWASGQVVVVEACTNLDNPIWSPLQTNTLTNGSIYFSDPQWTNYPARFYLIRSP